MVAIKTEDLTALRSAVFPLVHAAKRADLKCSSENMSLIISHNSPRFIAALRMAAPFFTSFDSDDDEDYHYRILLDSFCRDLCSFTEDDVFLTIFLREGQTIVPLKFENPRTGYLQYSAFILLPPRNMDVGEIDYRVFVAIKSAEFRNITRELYIYYHETICVTLTESQAKFSVAAEEIIVTTERKQCIIGGVAAGDQIQFLITLNPKNFFLHASFLSNFVWLFKSTDSCSLIRVPFGLHANILIHFSQ